MILLLALLTLSDPTRVNDEAWLPKRTFVGGRCALPTSNT